MNKHPSTFFFRKCALSFVTKGKVVYSIAKKEESCYDSLFPVYVICSLECKSMNDIEITSLFIFTISAVSEIGILMKLIVCDKFTGKLT